MIKRIVSLSLALILSIAFAGCARGNNNPDPTAAPENGDQTAYLNKPGQAVPLSMNVTDGSIFETAVYNEKYTGANYDFAIKMANANPDDWTGVYSPLSLQLALQILSNGADDETAAALLDSVCPGLTRSDVNASSAKLLSMLMNTEGFSVSNAVVVNSAYQLSEDFAKTAANYYRASVGALDFSDPKAALNELNGWIEQNTDGLVKELIDRVGPETAVVILNALTLKLKWEKPFVATRKLDLFNGLKGEEYIGMIKKTDELECGVFDEGTMALVPYAGGEYCMAVILPEKGVSPKDAVSALIGKTGECKKSVVEIMMPKVELNCKLNILEMADSIGIRDAVSGNYTNLIPNDDLNISSILHGASLSVTESGTTAAAATAIIIDKGISITVPDVTVICDRPYAMVIYHIETGTVLFVSIVNDVA